MNPFVADSTTAPLHFVNSAGGNPEHFGANWAKSVGMRSALSLQMRRLMSATANAMLSLDLEPPTLKLLAVVGRPRFLTPAPTPEEVASNLAKALCGFFVPRELGHVARKGHAIVVSRQARAMFCDAGARLVVDVCDEIDWNDVEKLVERYGRLGIREWWMVDVANRCVLQVDFVRMRGRRVLGNVKLTAFSCPALAISMGEIFRAYTRSANCL